LTVVSKFKKFMSIVVEDRDEEVEEDKEEEEEEDEAEDEEDKALGGRDTTGTGEASGQQTLLS
jgi:hypothetical protein